MFVWLKTKLTSYKKKLLGVYSSFMYYFLNWYVQAGYFMIIIKVCMITCLLKSPAPCSVSLQTQHWSRQSQSFLNCSKSPNSCIQFCSKFFLTSIFHTFLNSLLKSSYFFFLSITLWFVDTTTFIIWQMVFSQFSKLSYLYKVIGMDLKIPEYLTLFIF